MHWTQIAGIATAAAIAQMIRFWWGKRKENFPPEKLRKVELREAVFGGFVLGWMFAVLAFTTIAGWRN